MDKLAELAEKAERAGELKYIYTQRAQSDELEANAVATVINALNGIDSAVIQLSSVIVVKSDGRVIARVISEKELSVLRECPELLKSPRDILTTLPKLASDEVYDDAPSSGADVDGLVRCGQDGGPKEMTGALTDDAPGAVKQTNLDGDASYDQREVAARYGQKD